MTISKTKSILSLSLFAVLFVFLFTGCKKDDDDDKDIVLAEETYDLKTKDALGVSGTVTFYKRSSSTTIEITLSGITSGNHPAHIHVNSAIESGGIALTLNPVNAQGISVTSVSKLDDNTSVTYEQLIAFNGYINVHQSANNLGVIIAQGDIGGNKLTGASENYSLTEFNTSGVSGQVRFEKRKNNNTLVSISLNGTLSGETHPAQILLGDVTTVGGGQVVLDLNNINGSTGKSITNVYVLKNGTPIKYDDWVVYDGYLNVYESIINSTTIISQGNIGEL
ncbi:MAG: CHRD domain-containing protein [Chitinophagaceae bacterium]|nr:MAG: CHRD domain-containing protein [Chitinophagaceae bacterium]